MSSCARTVRRCGLVAACIASVMTGSALVWRMLSPDAVNSVLTVELLALLGLFLLPAMTVWSLLARRRLAPRPARRGRAQAHAESADAARPGRPVRGDPQTEPPLRPALAAQRDAACLGNRPMVRRHRRSDAPAVTGRGAGQPRVP